MCSRQGANKSIQYPSAYNQCIPTKPSSPSSHSTFSPDVLVIPANDPDTVIVTTRSVNVFDTGNECTLARILDLLSALRAKHLSSVKHIADLRSEGDDHRLGIVLQGQDVLQGRDVSQGRETVGRWAGGVEELVKGVTFSEDVVDGSECSGMDDEGWSYV